MILTAILTIFLIKDGIAYKDCDGLDRFPDYYWRDYKGTIPPDAVPGGKDAKGQTTYIGQVHQPNSGLLPAVIYADTKTLVVSADQLTLKPGTNTKILCARDQHLLKWIPTDISKIHQLIGYHFVIGGVQSDEVLLIGRRIMDEGKHKGELLVSKVFEYHNLYKGINVNINPQKSVALKEFEILAYDFKNCVN